MSTAPIPPPPPGIPADVWYEATDAERAGSWTAVELKSTPGSKMPLIESMCGCRAEVIASKDHPVRVLVCRDHAQCQSDGVKELLDSLIDRIGRAYTKWWAHRYTR